MLIECAACLFVPDRASNRSARCKPFQVSRQAFGPPAMCTAIAHTSIHEGQYDHPAMQCYAGLAQPETIVDVVERPATGDAFPGLYLNALSEQPFISASTLLLTTQWRSSTEVVAVDLDSRSVQHLRPQGSRGSWSLLAIGYGAPHSSGFIAILGRQSLDSSSSLIPH